MPFELWGVTGTFDLTLPDRLLGYLLLLLYSLLLAFIVYSYRSDYSKLSSRQWGITIGLSALSLLVSQLFPLAISPNPATRLILFTAVPFLLAGIILNPAAALVVGFSGGWGRSLGQTHILFDPFHFAFAAVLAAILMQQNYFGRFYQWLRHPVISGTLVNVVALVLSGLAAFVSTESSASYVASLDQALSTVGANFWPFLIEGALGGGIVALILVGVPNLRPRSKPVHSPFQLSLSKRLLSNYILFAVLLTVLLVAVVFTVSINVSTRLAVDQMAHNAETVLAELTEFHIYLQNLLAQRDDNAASLLGNNPAESEKSLEQLFRSSKSYYSRLLLVDSSQTIRAVYPPTAEDGGELASLLGPERTAVTRTFTTNTPNIASVQTPAEEHVLSFVAPVRDADGSVVAVLIGRVPRLSLNKLVVGLQGTLGQGSGFIVDEQDQIIAYSDSSQRRTDWDSSGSGLRTIRTGKTGVAYQGYRPQTNARELVYYEKGTNFPWTVVVTVPYEVVLNLALNIGGPLILILVLVTAVFYANLAVMGRDITQPITELVRAAKIIASGGSWAPSSSPQRNDEIGQLNRAFRQMHRSRNKQLGELSLLLDVSRAVAANIDINQGMPAILRGALRWTGAAGARAVVLNPSGSYPLTFGEGPAADTMAVLDRSIMRQLRHAPELILATPKQIRATLDTSKAAKLPVPALIAIPLHFHGRFQGVLWLGYQQSHSFDATVHTLLKTLAGQAAVLVENARLFAAAEGGRRRLAAVLASTTDAVIVTDQTERILLINPAMERAFQLKASEITARPVADVIKIEPLVKALTGDEEHVRNLEVSSNDGRIFYTSASTIISNDGQVLGRVAVLHDITRLKEIDQMKSDFVSTVSHDLRGPLTFMRGYTTMLPMVGELNKSQHEYADKILTGIDQMAQLVNDLLDLGRIEAGVDLQTEEIKIHALLSDLATDYWQHAHLNGIKLQVDVVPEDSTVKGDVGLIRQAMTNLIMNGIKYAADSGPMILKSEQLNGEVVISVQDNGPGIPKQEQIRLFEKFFRVKQRGTERIKGAGLGLAIVKSIAERHGGRVWCESQYGQGSTFSISLPMEPVENGQQT